MALGIPSWSEKKTFHTSILLCQQVTVRVQLFYVTGISFSSVRKQPRDKITPRFYVNKEWQNSSPGIAVFGDSF